MALSNVQPAAAAEVDVADSPGPSAPDSIGASRRAVRRYMLGRVVLIPVTVFFVITGAFFLMQSLSGNVVRALAGAVSTPALLRQVRHQFGLDHPIFQRYVNYLDGLVHGNFGHSYISGTAVGTDLLHRLPVTLELIIPAYLLALTLGVILGVVGAYHAGAGRDHAARWFTSFFQATPDYVVGLVLIYLFFFLWHIAPAPTGQLGITDPNPPAVTNSIVVDSILAGQWSTFTDALAHLALPVITLTLTVLPIFARITRGRMVAALSSDYVRFARASGLPERTVVGYALRDARSALLGYGAWVLASIVGGVPILEFIFNWPGVGNWALTGILNLDLPVVLGFVVVVGAGVVIVYFLFDILTARLDPRVKLAGS